MRIIWHAPSGRVILSASDAGKCMKITPKFLARCMQNTEASTLFCARLIFVFRISSITLVLLLSSAHAGQMRMWKSVTGNTAEAVFIEHAGEYVVLESNKTQLWIRFRELSKEDQTYVLARIEDGRHLQRKQFEAVPARHYARPGTGYETQQSRDDFWRRIGATGGLTEEEKRRRSYGSTAARDMPPLNTSLQRKPDRRTIHGMEEFARAERQREAVRRQRLEAGTMTREQADEEREFSSSIHTDLYRMSGLPGAEIAVPWKSPHNTHNWIDMQTTIGTDLPRRSGRLQTGDRDWINMQQFIGGGPSDGMHSGFIDDW